MNIKLKKPLILVLLLLLFASPFFLAHYFFYRYGSQVVSTLGTMNKGILIKPAIPLKEILNRSTLALQQGSKIVQNKWYILYVISSKEQSNALIEKTVDKIQRIRLSLGKDFSKVGFFLAGSKNTMRKVSALSKEISVVPRLVLNKKGVNELLLTTSAEESIFIMDPKQRILLAYPIDVNSEDIYKDIQRLFQYESR